MSKASEKKKRARKKANAKARNVEHNRAERRWRDSQTGDAVDSGQFVRRSLAATGGTRGRRRVQRSAS